MVNYISLIKSSYPVLELFSSDETDYMFSTILDFIDHDIVYEKSSKNYEEVCQDYMKFAIKKINL